MTQHHRTALRHRLGGLLGAAVRPSVALHVVVPLCYLYWYDDLRGLEGTPTGLLLVALIPLSGLVPLLLEDLAHRLRR